LTENTSPLITAYSFHFSLCLWILPDFIWFCSEKKAAKIKVDFDYPRGFTTTTEWCFRTFHALLPLESHFKDFKGSLSY